MIYETGFNIEVAEAGPCPITVEILDPEYADWNPIVAEFGLTVLEARKLAAGLIEACDEYDDLYGDRFVQVRFSEGGRLYTHRDPSRALQIGMTVLVPVRNRSEAQEATVVKVGRNQEYTGPCSNVQFVWRAGFVPVEED